MKLDQLSTINLLFSVARYPYLGELRLFAYSKNFLILSLQLAQDCYTILFLGMGFQ